MIELSVALVFITLIIRDMFRHWVKHVELKTFQGKQIEAQAERIDQVVARAQELANRQMAHEDEQAVLVKKLAEDWARKFTSLEAGNAAMVKHIDSQVAGTIAQLPATGRGFGR